MNENQLQIILRSHECVMNGVEMLGNTNLYTIFSCTNYGGKAKNKACILYYHNRKEILQNKELEYEPSAT